MGNSESKLTTIDEAVDRYVKSGSILSIGGFTINRNPMAAVYEIIRQRKRDLHICAHSNGHGIDELIGGGCVSRIEIAYAGSGRFAPTCIRFKKAIEKREIMVEDYSNFQMTLRFLAGAMGLPFLPTCSSFGTDIIEKWGFSRETREEDPRLPDRKLAIIDNPFGEWAEAKRVVCVPAIYPDVTIIHSQYADSQGTVRIEGLSFADVEQAKAAKHVIVTCERLVDPDFLRKRPEHNQIPFIFVDAVVHLPHGAYPTACYRHYDYDPVFLSNYRKWAQDDQAHKEYLDEYVFGTENHRQFLEKVGEERLAMIQADPETGYATGLNRSEDANGG